MIDPAERLGGLIGVPLEFATAIGYMTLTFSLMESDIDQAIWQILGLNRDAGSAITAPIINVRTRADMLKTLVGLKVDDNGLKGDFDLIYQHVESVTSKRNDIIHGQMTAWSGGFETVGFMRTSAGGKIKRKTKTYSTDKIYETADEAFVTYTALQDFINGLRGFRAEESPLRKIPLPRFRVGHPVPHSKK